MQDHLRELDELSDKLAAIGEEVSDNHKLAVLLQSVQDSYPTLVTALLAKEDDDLALVFAKQALLDEEQRRGKTGTESGGVADSKGGDTALKARKFFGKRLKSGACHYCGQHVTSFEIVSPLSKTRPGIEQRLPKNTKRPVRTQMQEEAMCLWLQWGSRQKPTTNGSSTLELADT